MSNGRSRTSPDSVHWWLGQFLSGDMRREAEDAQHYVREYDRLIDERTALLSLIEEMRDYVSAHRAENEWRRGTKSNAAYMAELDAVIARADAAIGGAVTVKREG